MTLKNDLEEQVKKTFSTAWSLRNGQIVPEDSDLRLGNDGMHLDAVCLYADMAKSTLLVDSYNDEFASEIYKNFLYCSSKIIRDHGGYVTAFDGDRVMGIFIGGSKNTNAAKTALKINWAVKNIINPAIKAQYNNGYMVEHAVGIDASKILVSRVGFRGSNDLIWVSRAANYAAKLCSLREDNYKTWITESVYNQLNDSAKIGNTTFVNMWEKRYWTDKNIYVYTSIWSQIID